MLLVNSQGWFHKLEMSSTVLSLGVTNVVCKNIARTGVAWTNVARTDVAWTNVAWTNVAWSSGIGPGPQSRIVPQA